MISQPFNLSGKPVSNRRPSAWEADALPTELRPHTAAWHILLNGARGTRTPDFCDVNAAL